MHGSTKRCAWATKTPSKLWQPKTQMISILILVADRIPQMVMKRNWSTIRLPMMPQTPPPRTQAPAHPHHLGPQLALVVQL